MKETWTRKEVAEITGIPDRRVLFYTEQPLLLPGVKKDTGRGTARLYTIESIFYLLVIKELSELGLSLTQIRLIVTMIVASEQKPFLKMKGYPEFELWENGKFTKTPVIMVIASDDSKPHSINMGFVVGEIKVKLKADKSSQIILNLNEIFNKAVF